jgi:hypothetical protein
MRLPIRRFIAGASHRISVNQGNLAAKRLLSRTRSRASAGPQLYTDLYRTAQADTMSLGRQRWARFVLARQRLYSRPNATHMFRSLETFRTAIVFGLSLRLNA